MPSDRTAASDCNVCGAKPGDYCSECTDPAPHGSEAASTDLAMLTEAEFWPLVEQAKSRVITNDLDALESLIVGGLPPDEMQAAAWALVQRVRGLRADLMRIQRKIVEARSA